MGLKPADGDLSHYDTLKGEFQICPRMDLDNNLYVEYLPYNNYKNEIISFLKGCKATGGHLDVYPLCTNICYIKYQF